MKLWRKFRGGHWKLTHVAVAATAPSSIILTSDTFEPGALLPKKCAGKGIGDNVSPSLRWSEIPEETAELVLIVEDPDLPLPAPVTHCSVTAIDPSRTSLPEGALNTGQDDMTIGHASMGRHGYQGPRPLPGFGTHDYVFQLFAIDTRLNLPANVKQKDLRAAIEGHVLAVGTLVGTYRWGAK